MILDELYIKTILSRGLLIDFKSIMNICMLFDTRQIKIV